MKIAKISLALPCGVRQIFSLESAVTPVLLFDGKSNLTHYSLVYRSFGFKAGRGHKSQVSLLS